MRSYSQTVRSRCAIVITVELEKASRIKLCSLASAILSIELEASSMSSIFGRRSNALASANNCRSPAEKLWPPSATRSPRFCIDALAVDDTPVALLPWEDGIFWCEDQYWATFARDAVRLGCAVGGDEALLAKPTLYSTSHSSLLSYSSKGSRLSRIVPLKSTASCDMTVRFRLKSDSPICEMSIPSIVIEPLSASMNRKRAKPNVLFPEPVRPTRPTFSPALIENVRSVRTSGNPSA